MLDLVGDWPIIGSLMFTKTTNAIKVTAIPEFLAEHSEPIDGHYVWAYTIEVANYGKSPVRLLNRYWNITDADGLTHEVAGVGVVGEQPVIAPGESFRYTSGTSLNTASGLMLGRYSMQQADNGEPFEVDIPAFSLDSPYVTALIN